jgi:hypothetical protein
VQIACLINNSNLIKMKKILFLGFFLTSMISLDAKSNVKKAVVIDCIDYAIGYADGAVGPNASEYRWNRAYQRGYNACVAKQQQ